MLVTLSGIVPTLVKLVQPLNAFCSLVKLVASPKPVTLASDLQPEKASSKSFTLLGIVPTVSRLVHPYTFHSFA